MARFRSVVVITFASHAKGPGFETRRNLGEAFYTVCNTRERNSIYRREGVQGRKKETGQMDSLHCIITVADKRTFSFILSIDLNGPIVIINIIITSFENIRTGL